MRVAGPVSPCRRIAVLKSSNSDLNRSLALAFSSGGALAYSPQARFNASSSLVSRAYLSLWSTTLLASIRLAEDTLSFGLATKTRLASCDGRRMVETALAERRNDGAVQRHEGKLRHGDCMTPAFTRRAPTHTRTTDPIGICFFSSDSFELIGRTIVHRSQPIRQFRLYACFTHAHPDMRCETRTL